jgi:hypothetical protein
MALLDQQSGGHKAEPVSGARYEDAGHSDYLIRYDTRARKGGGGAIDLAMHVLGLSFADAVKHLTEHASLHGQDHP